MEKKRLPDHQRGNDFTSIQRFDIQLIWHRKRSVKWQRFSHKLHKKGIIKPKYVSDKSLVRSISSYRNLSILQ